MCSFIKQVVSFQWFGYYIKCKCNKTFNFFIHGGDYSPLSPIPSLLGAPVNLIPKLLKNTTTFLIRLQNFKSKLQEMHFLWLKNIIFSKFHPPPMLRAFKFNPSLVPKFDLKTFKFVQNFWASLSQWSNEWNTFIFT